MFIKTIKGEMKMQDSNYPQMKILETESCILRPVTINDVKDLFEYYKQDIVVKFLPFNKHNTIEDTKKFINLFFLTNYRQGKIGHFAIVFKGDKKVIGNVGFNNISTNATEGEIGICINPLYWGHNLSTELAVEMLRFGFNDLSLNRIIAVIFDQNTHSKKPLEILGFNYVGKFYKKIHSTRPPKQIICHKYEMIKRNYVNNLYF